jgi:hypothetical protein
MKQLLANAGREFLRAFGASLIVVLPGVLAAPNLDASFGLGVAALFASLAAVFKAIQEFVPGLSFAGLVRQPIAAWLDAFSRAALGALIVSVIGILNAPDLSTSRAAITAAVIGALSAGLRALEGLGTVGESPAPDTGLER